jgi:hypothetical protein
MPGPGITVQETTMRFSPAILILLIVFCIPTASAGEVSLATGQSVYYALAGTEAVVPISVASTWGHDVTGTLQQSMTRLTPGANGSHDTIVQSREFSAFAEPRTVPLPVGESDEPGDYLVTVAFRYDEGGARTATLGGIVVRFVTRMDGPADGGGARTGTDSVDTAAASPSSGTTPDDKPAADSPKENPEAALQNSQMTQDAPALRKQMAEENNRSEQVKDELLGIIMADPLVLSQSRSLAGAGFSLNRTGIVPASNRSGRFVLTYASGPKNAAIRGSVRESRVLFAEESADEAVPLPGALQDNATYREYGIRVAENGFVLSETRINSTPGRETVDITYTGSRTREIRLHAEILNGSVITVAGESPEDPLAAATPFIALLCAILISAGIWYLARFRQEDPPASGNTDPAPSGTKTPREIALHLLDRAEEDAARGSWPEAYRKTGRAIRIVLSHELGQGGELTGGELERLTGHFAGETGRLGEILHRCQLVGFAKDGPHTGELPAMIGYCRAWVNGQVRGEEEPV